VNGIIDSLARLQGHRRSLGSEDISEGGDRLNGIPRGTAMKFSVDGTADGSNLRNRRIEGGKLDRFCDAMISIESEDFAAES